MEYEYLISSLKKNKNVFVDEPIKKYGCDMYDYCGGDDECTMYCVICKSHLCLSCEGGVCTICGKTGMCFGCVTKHCIPAIVCDTCRHICCDECGDGINCRRCT